MKYAKRIMALALACLIMFSLVPPVTAQAATSVFSDVGTSHKYYKEIMFLYNNGIFTGKTTTKFAPDDTILREQMVTVLWRIAGEPVVNARVNFTDNTNSTTYYHQALRWAKATGVSDGYADGTFGVGKAMTHQEVIQFLANFAVKIVKRSTAADMQNTAAVSGFSTYSWGKGTLNWAIKNKLINASQNPEFKKANNSCTRGSTALILYNFYKQFRKTYALVASTTDAYTGMPNPNLDYMVAALNKYMVRGTSAKKDNSISSQSGLTTAFNNTFGSATCIDVCYFYINSHGRSDGLTRGNPRKVWLYPQDLYNMISKYSAKFVVMIDACQTENFTGYFATNKSKADLICSAKECLSSTAKFIDTSSATTAVASYCWASALDGDASVSYRQSGDKYVAVSIKFSGDSDGFISIKELYETTRCAIKNIAENTAYYAQTIGYYSPSNQPAYCAFGILD